MLLHNLMMRMMVVLMMMVMVVLMMMVVMVMVETNIKYGKVLLHKLGWKS